MKSTPGNLWSLGLQQERSRSLLRAGLQVGPTMPGLKMSYLEFVYMCIGPIPVSNAGFCQI